MSRRQTPEDLAQYLFKYLKLNAKDVKLPNLSILTDLFEILYYGSMRSEEGEFIQTTVTFYNPDLQDEDLDDDDSYDHWRFTKFKNPIQLNEKSLVKLSKAADPWSSSIAVFFDDNENLMIYGLIDQAIHNQNFLSLEIENRPPPAGYFQVAIQGIGIISVTSGYKLISVLRQNSLVTSFLDVWRFGPISELIEMKAQTFVKDIKNFLLTRFPKKSIEDIEEKIYKSWGETISRLLIQIRRYNHGGALLIATDTSGIVINYPIRYVRLRGAILRQIKNSIQIDALNEKINKSGPTIEKSIYKELQMLQFEKLEIINELKGAIRFIASQSCVDGIIILDDNLRTIGFGGIIENVDPPKQIYLASAANFQVSNLEEISPSGFGTRHRSMMTYCSRNPETIGFVTSQDGELRVMSQINDRLVIWENVKTHRYIKAVRRVI